ncbi:protein of unknown function [Shinella sp. WSC3-e]|nr:hypothetical protein SHINE37_43864 [Rhizobiaceae bacterium]CAK7258394.1 protein of unknown function [Shinella sp. WSC3-e]
MVDAGRVLLLRHRQHVADLAAFRLVGIGTPGIELLNARRRLGRGNACGHDDEGECGCELSYEHVFLPVVLPVIARPKAVPSMPVSATHDDDLIHFDLIQVTKPSTCAHFTKVIRAAPGQIRVKFPLLPSGALPPVVKTLPLLSAQSRAQNRYARLLESLRKASVPSPHLVR